MPSTARNETVSRIQPVLEEGASVVTSRGDVRYVVTEYGIADLWGKSIRERAMALIEIAHPDFRAELLAGAKERRYVFADQLVPRAVVPWRETRTEKLRNGATVVVRPLTMSDEEPLQRLFYELSDESKYRRFFCFKRSHPHVEMQRMVDLDYEQSMGLIACETEHGEPVAMARYDVDPATRLAEIAFVVRDDWQRTGLGTLLMRRMAEIARAHGLPGFCADVLGSNTAMLKVFHRSGLVVTSKVSEGVCHLTLTFAK